jgi:hypothetical protein
LVLAARVLWMRLRFVLAVGALFVAIALWQQLGACWDRAMLWVAGYTGQERGVSPDTEYFCPMCPGVLSAWPEKCPVCKMPLVRRTKGQSQLLPEGVTARMQISPYRLQLAGIKTSVAGYLPLAHKIEVTGRVERDASGLWIAAPLAPWDAALLAAGMPAEVRADVPGAQGPFAAKIESLQRRGEGQGAAYAIHVRLEHAAEPLAGALATVVVSVPLASHEPFRSLPRSPPPLTDASPRKVFICPDHPSWIRARRGKCPFDDNDLAEHALRDDQRLVWSCPWHGGPAGGGRCEEPLLHEVRIQEPPPDCPDCRRPCVRLRVATYAPPGEVLVVPESSVIETAGQRIVFVETMPGMFDGVAIETGPKSGGYFPIVSGLEPGQRVAAAGAFLLDAETRLNPALAASYFGAGSTSTPGTPGLVIAASAPTPDLLSTLKLAADDLALARRQKVCPITKMPLGSMGELVRVEVEGEPVFLCCESCRDSIRPASLTGSAREARQP